MNRAAAIELRDAMAANNCHWIDEATANELSVWMGIISMDDAHALALQKLHQNGFHLSIPLMNELNNWLEEMKKPSGKGGHDDAKAPDEVREVKYNKPGTTQSLFNPASKPEKSEAEAKSQSTPEPASEPASEPAPAPESKSQPQAPPKKMPQPESQPESQSQPKPEQKSGVELALEAALKAVAEDAKQRKSQQEQREQQQKEQQEQQKQAQQDPKALDDLTQRVVKLETDAKTQDGLIEEAMAHATDATGDVQELTERVVIIEANYVGQQTFQDSIDAFEAKLAQVSKPTIVKIGERPEVKFEKRVHCAFSEVLFLAQMFGQAYLVGPAGSGKCLGYNTPVMLATGEIVPVQDIKQGDLLMGPDSTPRRVVSTTTGCETMYRVVPTKGDSWECNESHILSMVVSEKNSGWTQGQIVNITVKDYLALSKCRKKTLKQYRTGVDFAEQAVPLNPYFLGLWLGDGHSHAGVITNSDPEVIEYIKEFAESNQFAYSSHKDPRSNAITHRLKGENHLVANSNNLVTQLRNINVIDNKHIPAVYLHNSRKVRLDVLAGLLDTDGFLQSNHYEICTVHPELRDSLVYLCRSLGLYANWKIKPTNFENANTAYRIHISGHLDEIPCIVKRRQAAPRKQVKNVLRTAITLENLGEGDYYGFELEGPDRLFLLGDFTVTHNTSCAEDVATAMGREFGFISCSAGMAEAHLLGRMIANGTYLSSRFVQLYENGGLFLFDEVDAADANTMLVLNSALANGYLSVPNRQDNPVAKRHADFVCLVAANTLGTGSFEYHGRNYLDAAFLDRFALSRHQVEYDLDLEREMLAGDAEMGRVLHKMRFNLEQSKTRRVLSTRAFVSTAKLLLAGKDPQYVIDKLVLGWTDEEKNRAKKDVVVPKTSPLKQIGVKQLEAAKTRREQEAANMRKLALTEKEAESIQRSKTIVVKQVAELQTA